MRAAVRAASLRQPCVGFGTVLEVEPVGEQTIVCHSCNKSNRARGALCDVCGNTVGLKLKYDVESARSAA